MELEEDSRHYKCEHLLSEFTNLNNLFGEKVTSAAFADRVKEEASDSVQGGDGSFCSYCLQDA